MQYLVVIALITVVYFFFIKKRPITNTTSKKSTQKKTKPQSNDMVECSTCGIYCEVDDSILSNGKYYCSSECLDEAV